MNRIDQSALLPFSADQLYDLVNDIESYPEFMDGCISTKIIERTENEVLASLELGKAGLRYSFTTRNALVPGKSMVMSLVEGPFRHFDAVWSFRSLDDSACKISLKMEFEFSSGLVDAALKHLFESTSRNLVYAVCMRAEQLYG